MAAAPIDVVKSYRVSDRRSSSGYQNDYPGYRNNTLFKGAVQTGERKFQFPTDKDTRCNVSNFGRRTLMTLGRILFGNVPTIGGAIIEQAGLASEVFIPQFYGADKDWGNLAEAWLLEWNKICDVAGPPYDFDAYLEQIVIAYLRDGDMGTLLCETPDQYPQIQIIPGHRIGSRADVEVLGGEFDGLPMSDGVILSPQRRALAYRVFDEYETGSSTDVSARDMFLSFIPEWGDHVRGFSKLASAILDLQAFRDSRDNELLAQVACAAHALIEENETGQLDPAKASILGARTWNTDSTAANQSSGLTTESIQGGTYRYFRSNSGSKLQAFQFDRPAANSMNFQENVVRDCFRGINWDYYFSVDPTKPGGAALRIIIDKINRTLNRLRKMQKKAATRVHGFALCKAMNLGLLPWNDDWWMWTYQTAARLTADAKYDSDVAVQEMSNVIVSPQKVCGERGEYWEDVQDEWIDAQARFQREAKAKGVDLSLVRLGTSSMQNAPPQNPAANDPREKP